jgi:hypothetical protein
MYSKLPYVLGNLRDANLLLLWIEYSMKNTGKMKKPALTLSEEKVKQF